MDTSGERALSVIVQAIDDREITVKNIRVVALSLPKWVAVCGTLKALMGNECASALPADLY